MTDRMLVDRVEGKKRRRREKGRGRRAKGGKLGRRSCRARHDIRMFSHPVPSHLPLTHQRILIFFASASPSLYGNMMESVRSPPWKASYRGHRLYTYLFVLLSYLLAFPLHSLFLFIVRPPFFDYPSLPIAFYLRSRPRMGMLYARRDFDLLILSI